MVKPIQKVLDKLDDAAFLKMFHGISTIVWGALIPITVFTGLKNSIIWIAMMSVWANFVGHFSSWQASRAEVKIDKQNNTAKMK
jgi:uncharacterized membrane protein